MNNGKEDPMNSDETEGDDVQEEQRLLLQPITLLQGKP